MLNEIGWPQSQLNTFKTIKTADYVCDISGSHYVDLKSSFPTKTMAAGLNRSGILTRIQLDVLVYFKQPVDYETSEFKNVRPWNKITLHQSYELDDESLSIYFGIHDTVVFLKQIRTSF